MRGATDATQAADAARAADATGAGLEVFVLGGFGEIVPGDDLAALILAAATEASADASADASTGANTDANATASAPASRTTVLRDGDILAVTSKIVSKAEGRIVPAADREQAISDETVRVVASRVHPNGVTRIVENRQGLVMAAAGVDASNTAEGTVLLLPVDPDASARALCTTLREATGLRLGVIITDTAGRVWRDGQTDIAIGAAGVLVLDDLRGTTDSFGHRLAVTAAAAGDEIAGAADLVKGKTSKNPVAVVRGLGRLVVSDTDANSDASGADAADADAAGAAETGAPTSASLAARGARILQRDSANDMFRLGSAEAHAEGYAAGFEAGLAQGQAAGFAAGLAAAHAHATVDESAAGESSSDAPGSEPA